MAKLPLKPPGYEHYHWHHIIPQSRGGSDEPDNLVLLTPMEHVQAHKDRYDKYGDYGDMQSANFLLAHIDPNTGLSFKGYKQSQKHIEKRLASTDHIARGKAISAGKKGHEVTQETRDKLSNNPALKKSKKDDVEANKNRSETMKIHRLNKHMNIRFDNTLLKGML